MKRLLADPRHRRRVAAKRAADTALILAASPVVAVVGAATALATGAFLGRPVIFKQTRIGMGEKPFTLYKFRSMLDEVDAAGKVREPSERLTKFGRLLRKSSLDEIPQLWNVLKGDMSLIGPRPLLPEYVPYYRDHERARHAVRPGITGLAQTSGRNTLDWDGRLATDVEYAAHGNFSDDVVILAKTFQQIATKEGLNVVPGAHQQFLHVERA